MQIYFPNSECKHLRGGSASPLERAACPVGGKFGREGRHKDQQRRQGRDRRRRRPAFALSVVHRTCLWDFWYLLMYYVFVYVLLFFIVFCTGMGDIFFFLLQHFESCLLMCYCLFMLFIILFNIYYIMYYFLFSRCCCAHFFHVSSLFLEADSILGDSR